MKKIVALTLATLLCMLLLCNCSANPSSSASQAGAANEPTPLRILTCDNYYAAANYDQNLPVWEQIEKDLNVKITWELVPNSELTDTINTTLSSGQNLPDIIFGWFDVQKAYKGGLIVDMTPMLEEHAPNAYGKIEKNPQLKGLITSSDGKILSIPQTVLTDDLQRGFVYRKDYFDKLNLEVPKTTEEFVAALKALRDGDPNGNGMQDEIPFVDEGGTTYLCTAGSMFNVYPDLEESEFTVEENGEVTFTSTTPKFKEFLKFMNTLYSQQLLCQDFATIPYDKINSQLLNNQICIYATWINVMDSLNGQMPDAEWSVFLPPEGPYGPAKVVRRIPASGNCAITKDAKNPEVAMKFIDYIWASEEGIRYNNYGVEGLSYTMENGKPVPTDFLLNNPDGLSYGDAIRSIGGQWNLPQEQDKDIMLAMASDEVRAFNEEIKKIECDPYPGLIVPMTEEEQMTLNEVYSDIKTYRDEMMLRFIMGKDDIDAKWDEYVSTLNGLGVDRLVADQQNIYKRYSNS